MKRQRPDEAHQGKPQHCSDSGKADHLPLKIPFRQTTTMAIRTIPTSTLAGSRYQKQDT
jgi:hypothetical protein